MDHAGLIFVGIFHSFDYITGYPIPTIFLIFAVHDTSIVWRFKLQNCVEQIGI